MPCGVWRTVGLIFAVIAGGWTQPTLAQTLAAEPSEARAADGAYISWREHIIDDEAKGGVAIRGSDGLAMADLDGDGYEDVVSVHEADTTYGGAVNGLIRIAFGTADPDQWHRVTLAAGAEAGAAEDVAIADVNGDGHLDIVAACELAHLIYFENPGADIRAGDWPRLIPPGASGRGSFIRVFLADLTGDGRPEVVTANKGAQDPRKTEQKPRAISWFEIDGAPLDGDAWVEHELTRVPWPINARPVDLDGDGDIDVIGGSVAEARMTSFENRGEAGPDRFREYPIIIASDGSREPSVNGFNMDFADLNGDGRRDIIVFEGEGLLGDRLVWLEQPETPDAPWPMHAIGDYGPDRIVGLAVADINGNGHPDIMTGGYSLGPRDRDGEVGPTDPLGRLAWFENPGPGKGEWRRHDISRRARGMFDMFIPRDMDGDGDIDFVSTRGNSAEYDGVFWLEQIRSPEPRQAFTPARQSESREIPLPANE